MIDDSGNLSLENGRADAGRDGRTCLARPNSQARTGTGKKRFPCSADHEQDWQPYTRLIHSKLKVLTIHPIHTYMHTCTVPAFFITTVGLREKMKVCSYLR